MEYAIEEAKKCNQDVPIGCVIKKDGEIVGKSTLAIDDKIGLGVFNNFELRREENSGLGQEQVYKKYIIAINEFAKIYNKKFPEHKLKRITVGMHMNDLGELIKARHKKAAVPIQAIDYTQYGSCGNRYTGDSLEEQRILWEENEEKE